MNLCPVQGDSRSNRDDSLPFSPVVRKSVKDSVTDNVSRPSKSSMRSDNAKVLPPFFYSNAVLLTMLLQDESTVSSCITVPASKTDAQVFHFSKLGTKDESVSYEGKVPISVC